MTDVLDGPSQLRPVVATALASHRIYLWSRNPGEKSGTVGPCTPRLAVTVFDQKCIGGPNSLCQQGYSGAYCTDCAPNYYRTQRIYCLPCVEGEQRKMYVYLGCFVLISNVLFFCAPEDIVNAAFSTVSVLQMFRAIGMMGSQAVPDGIFRFYQQLGLVTLDFEFSQPGIVMAYIVMDLELSQQGDR